MIHRDFWAIGTDLTATMFFKVLKKEAETLEEAIALTMKKLEDKTISDKLNQFFEGAGSHACSLDEPSRLIVRNIESQERYNGVNL